MRRKCERQSFDSVPRKLVAITEDNHQLRFAYELPCHQRFHVRTAFFFINYSCCSGISTTPESVGTASSSWGPSSMPRPTLDAESPRGSRSSCRTATSLRVSRPRSPCQGAYIHRQEHAAQDWAIMYQGGTRVFRNRSAVCITSASSADESRAITKQKQLWIILHTVFSRCTHSLSLSVP